MVVKARRNQLAVAQDYRKAREFRDKARRYRTLAQKTGDDEAANRTSELAAQPEQQARDMEQNK